MKILSSAAFTRARSAPRRLLPAALVPALAAVLAFTGAAVSQAATTHSPAARPVPVLGRVSGTFFRAKGLGRVKPHRVDLGGDPTSIVSGITWSSWGGARATGTGSRAGCRRVSPSPTAGCRKPPSWDSIGECATAH